MCFTCRGGSRGVGGLTTLGAAMRLGGSVKERPSRAWGEGEGGAGIIMSSNDVGSYELKRTPCDMQMEGCSAHLARSASDGSADYLSWDDMSSSGVPLPRTTSDGSADNNINQIDNNDDNKCNSNANNRNNDDDDDDDDEYEYEDEDDEDDADDADDDDEDDDDDEEERGGG